MIKAIFRKSFVHKKIKIFLIVFSLILFVAIAIANSPRGDVKLALGIEIGDEDRDFLDTDKTVEKGRFVEFQINLKNNSSNSYKGHTLLMDIPDYMKYVSGTTKLKDGDTDTNLLDLPNGISVLEVGYDIENIKENTETFFTIQYQVDIDVPAEEAYSA